MYKHVQGDAWRHIACPFPEKQARLWTHDVIFYLSEKWILSLELLVLHDRLTGADIQINMSYIKKVVYLPPLRSFSRVGF